MRICDFDGCDNKHYGKGWCAAHLSQFKKGKVMVALGAKRSGTKSGFARFCIVEYCENQVHARSLCRTHYIRVEKGQSLDEPVIGSPEYWHECEVPWCARDASFKFPICQRHRRVARQYGMTPAGYRDFCAPGKCKACGGDDRLSVHHDHGCCGGGYSCGKCVVALLCFSCNLCAGVVGDSPERLRILADVIELKTDS